MNKYIYYLLLTLLVSCSKDEPLLEDLVNSINIKSETRFLIANNISTINIELETNLSPIESFELDVKYYANGEQITKNFKTNISGYYTIWAEINSIKSNELTLFAREKVNDYNLLTFKVIFHVVNFNISSETIYDNFDKLNTTFRMPFQISDPNAVDTKIKFSLVDETPEGIPLEEIGIIRHTVNSNYTIRFESWMWDIYWDPDYYINIWVGNTGSTSSFATYPVVNSNSNIEGVSSNDITEVNYLHGIAIRPNHLNRLNTISHEMGHFFGLKHVFGPERCNYSDYCDDTLTYDRDAYEAATSTFQEKRESCFNIKFNSWNIMDYSEQVLRNSITYNQRERMRDIIIDSKWSGFNGTQNKYSSIKKIKSKVNETLYKKLIVH